ncbi:hypothetical protein AB0J71_36285 [Nonomuraea sp. NPDC049637]|uniref:hypothetical protein n=1 Tax=Nonomuraea sp. NPDC049637 TaxID=3154356 RepID=UPI003431F699
MTAQPAQPPGPNDGVDQALADVLTAIGTASLALAVQRATNMACHGDRRRLAVCLDAMGPGRLAEVTAAARLLGAAAEQALARRNP